MLTHGGDRTQSTSTYRQARRSAMSVYLTAPFFRRLRRWGVEVFYRGFKRTLDQHKRRSDAPPNPTKVASQKGFAPPHE